MESLEQEVELVQSELRDILTRKSKLDSDHASVEQVAQSELEAAKAKRKADELSRAQLKGESKTLEETKHQLDTQKAKLDKANKLLIADLERKAAEKDKWLHDIESAKLKVQKYDKAIERIKLQGQEQIAQAQQELEELQCTTSGLDDEIKGLASSTKRTDSLKSASLQALTQAKGKTDKVTGIINNTYVTKILENPDVHSKLKDALKSELEYEKQLEDEWKQTQKDLETRYLKVNVMYSEAKKAYDKAVEMHNKASQGNESNPVYDAVAAAAAAAAGNSYNGEIQGHPIAPTTSNVSANGKKRRGRSRRNTKSQTSSTYVGSPQQAFASVAGANSPMYTSATPVNNVVQSRAGFEGFQSPDMQFAPLTTSVSAISASTPTTTWDMRPPPVPVTNASDIQSPNVLLPSYLLKDDVTESLSSILGNNNRDLDLDMSFFNSLASTSGRPSGGILGRALHKRGSSNDSLHSAGGSANSSSLDVPSMHTEAPFPNRQISPQSSFSHLFQQSQFSSPSTDQVSPPATLDTGLDQPFPSEDGVKPNKGKFSSMFFFGKPRNQARSTSGGHPPPQDHSGGHSLFFKKTPHRIDNDENQDSLSPPPNFGNDTEVSMMGRRRRSGSLNSIGSLPVSFGESFNASGMLNLWGDTTTRPNSGLEPSRSHISTTLSSDRNPNNSKVFGPSSILANNRTAFDSQASGLGWSSFANTQRSIHSAANSIKDDNQLEATWDHMPNNTISHLKAEELDPSLSLIGANSTESTSPQPNKGRFSKGFASLFSSNASTGSSNEQSRNTTRSIDEAHEQASLVNSASDTAISVDTDASKDSTPVAAAPKETILQKSMRTFSLPRKASSSTTPVKMITSNDGVSPLPKPSKFTMRRLSMFSKKGVVKDTEEDLGVMKEDEGNPVDAEVDPARDSMDFQEFLAQAHKQSG